MTESRHILIVDPDRPRADALGGFLRQNGFRASIALGANEAFDRLLDDAPELIFVNGAFQDLAAATFCSQLRDRAAARAVPIILAVSSEVAPEERAAGFRAGADDVIISPFDAGEFLARAQAILRRSRIGARPETMSELQAVIFEKKTAASVPAAPVAAVTAPTTVTPAAAGAQRPSRLPSFTARVWRTLNKPSAVFSEISEAADFLLSLLLVSSTPVLASFARLLSRGDGFDSWIGSVSLGLVANVVMWMGMAGLVSLTVPFFGAHLAYRRCLVLTGLAWAPRLVGAALSVIYAALAAAFALDNARFSAGLDLLPGVPAAAWSRFLSQISLFDAWAAWLTLMAVWAACDLKSGKRWNVITILIGTVCLAFGAFTSY